MFDVNSPGLNERFIYRELPQLLAVSVFQHAVQVFSDGRGVCIKSTCTHVLLTCACFSILWSIYIFSTLLPVAATCPAVL